MPGRIAKRRIGSSAVLSGHQAGDGWHKEKARSDALFERRNGPLWDSMVLFDLVEAAGIEPASRDISTQTSTCVVGEFNFACSTPHRQGFGLASRKLYFAACVSNIAARLVGIGDGRPGRPDVSP